MKLKSLVIGIGLAAAALYLAPGAFAATAIYYSVGTSTADLKTTADTLYVTISSGTATFDEAQADNIGVGDKITYNTSNVCYISGRTSSTVYTVITATGGTPSDVTNATVNSITRTFNSLSTAESSSSGASYLNTSDLVTGNYQLNWPCYNDGVMDNRVTIYGWTTGSSNYIKVYTPVSSAEVGTSQRHNGTWGSGFRINPTSAGLIIEINESNVRIEGLAIKGYANGAGNEIINRRYYGSTEDIRISHNVLVGPAGGGVLVPDLGASTSGTIKIWNNIIYNTYTQYSGQITLADDLLTHYVYNNTIYGSGTSGQYGIENNGSTAGPIYATNNAVLNNATDFYGTITKTTNVSSDATGNIINKTSYSSYFINITSGSENLHLRGDSNSLWGSYGTDLDGDPNCPVTDDIDGDARDTTQPDIGADEYVIHTVYYSVGTSTSDLKNSATFGISSGTATFSAAQPDNVGVGDVITYNTSEKVYISGRTSSTVYSVVTAQGRTPVDVTAGTTVDSIKRVFNSLSTAESSSSGASYLNTSDLVAGNYQLNWPCYKDGTFTAGVTIDGYTTNADNYIRLYVPITTSEVGTSQRHNGTAGTGVKIDPTTAGDVITVSDDYTIVDGLEIADFGADSQVYYGIRLTGESNSTVRNTIVHDDVYYAGSIGIGHYSSGGGDYVYNNFIYSGTQAGNWYWGIGAYWAGAMYVYNNTIYMPANNGGYGIVVDTSSDMVAKNNLAITVSTPVFYTNAGSFSADSNYNASSDTSSPGANSLDNVTAASTFYSTTLNSENLHIRADSSSRDAATSLSSIFTNDIDNGTRPYGPAWDIGADETGTPTFVRVTAFTARQVGVDEQRQIAGEDDRRSESEGIIRQGVEVAWQTGCEIDNVGFNLYRGLTEGGPYEKLNSKIIPGLGDTTLGSYYKYLDTDLMGQRLYYYRLEDLDRFGKKTVQGVVSVKTGKDDE